MCCLKETQFKMYVLTGSQPGILLCKIFYSLFFLARKPNIRYLNSLLVLKYFNFKKVGGGILNHFRSWFPKDFYVIISLVSKSPLRRMERFGTQSRIRWMYYKCQSNPLQQFQLLVALAHRLQ